MSSRALLFFICLFMLPCFPALAGDMPSHERPFFMPQNKQDRVLQLIQKEEWAKADFARIKLAAGKGKGYEAAFLFALEGDTSYLPAAKKWLLEYGEKGGDIYNAKEKLHDPDFFRGGQPWIAPVYYNLDVSHMLAFDWIYRGLDSEERKIIEDGILTSARFRMKCMDRWSQTANLVFKPTYMVAMAGLVTGDKELLDWGFHRNPGSSRGGYFPVLDAMLIDGGPWSEANIYPIAHKGLASMAKMSYYRNLYDGRNWWMEKSAGGGSPKGLMDYYIDTAYPIEHTGYGKGQVRVVSYGDGATSEKGDLFLANPAGKGLNMTEELAAAYMVSGDTDYAAFLAMTPDYKPNLMDRRPLPEKIEWPTAPSKIWPDYGLAMLRSDESSAYWTSGKAIAVFQIMSQGYGHDHRDKFSITLHGADRLFYADYNNIQYENPSVGWTRNSIAHNTMIVDEGETGNTEPTGVRHEFTDEVKFLATSASGIFEGVDQTRALLLTRDYLLDLFKAESKVPHTYDYLLHSLGKIRTEELKRFKEEKILTQRYSVVQNQKSMNTDESWAVDFVIKEQPGDEKTKYGPEWYDHKAALRLTVAAEPGTLVVHGLGPDNLEMLIARHSEAQDTVFCAIHEPYAGQEQPKVTKITNIAQTKYAVVVRIDGKDFIDYAAVAFGPQKTLPPHAVTSEADPLTAFSFRNYGYLRIAADGKITARGGWTGFRLPHAAGPVTLNGQPADVTEDHGYLVFGKLPLKADPPLKIDPACPFPVTISPEVVRMFSRDMRKMTYKIRNTLSKPVSGWIEFDLPKGLTTDNPKTEFGPVNPGKTVETSVALQSNSLEAGRHIVPYRINYRQAGEGKIISTAARSIVVAVNAILEYDYQNSQSAVYRIYAPKLTAKLDMFHGLCRYLADDNDMVRLDGSPLFTFSDGNEDLLFGGTKKAFTWPAQIPASLSAQVYDRARYQILFSGDRMMVKMDKNWTQFEKAHFTVPGTWISPEGPPQWVQIISEKGQGENEEGKPGASRKVSAAELSFPGAQWNICFQFVPPKDVVFAGTGMKFELNISTLDSWTIGFCKPGTLQTWLWR
jgi:hypothetical protein